MDKLVNIMPWEAIWFLLIVFCALTLLWGFYALEALLKFCAVWKHGFPPAHCDALGDSWDDGKEEERG